MRNGHEGALCRLAGDAIIGKSLNLASQAIVDLFRFHLMWFLMLLSLAHLTAFLERTKP